MEKKYTKTVNWHDEDDTDELPPLVFKDGKLYNKSLGLDKSGENGDVEKKGQNIKKYVAPHRKNQKNLRLP